jgi:hypothetical protein
MEQCALRFQDEIYLPYSSWPTSCLPSEAGTTQTVLEALAAILDAAGRVMRRKKTATHFRAAKYQSWGGLCSEGTNNIPRVCGRLMTRKLAGPVRSGPHAFPGLAFDTICGRDSGVISGFTFFAG